MNLYRMSYCTVLVVLFYLITVGNCYVIPTYYKQDVDQEYSINKVLLNRLEQLEQKILSHSAEMGVPRHEFFAEMESFCKHHAVEISDLKMTFFTEISKMRTEYEARLSSMKTVECKERSSTTLNNAGLVETETDPHDTEVQPFDEVEISFGKYEMHNITLNRIEEVTNQTRKHEHTENGQHEQSPRVRRQQRTLVVAFFATLSKAAAHLGVNQNIVFDHVLTNIGNAYDANQGIFRAPVSGIYVFSGTIIVDQNGQTKVSFVLNRSRVTTMWLNGKDNSGDTNNNTIVLHLKQGDDVSLQHTVSDRSIFGNNHSMMSGFLLAQDDPENMIVGK